LAALMMSMGRLRDSLPGQGTLSHGFWRSCNDLARQAARETREISYSMHPHMLDEAGLGSALRCYARDFADLSGIEVNVDVQPDLARPSREIETTVFRIVQEALTNVHRHSGSRSASVYVACEDRRLRAEIRDDGCGLPATISGLRQSHVGVGITGMRERAEQMNGVFELESAPGQGTTVRVTLPLATGP
jgi:two-component system NarL family sensor kinase